MHGMLSMVDHTVGHKVNLEKFKKIEIILNIFFSDHSSVKLEMITERKIEKE